MAAADKIVVEDCPAVTEVSDKLKDSNRAREFVDVDSSVDGDCTDVQIDVTNVFHDVHEKNSIH
jgi:hypothetical protein